MCAVAIKESDCVSVLGHVLAARARAVLLFKVLLPRTQTRRALLHFLPRTDAQLCPLGVGKATRHCLGHRGENGHRRINARHKDRLGDHLAVLERSWVVVLTVGKGGREEEDDE